MYRDRRILECNKRQRPRGEMGRGGVNKRANLPLEGKAIRFAAGRGQEPAVSFWKVWTQGSEIYALSRSSAGVVKISINASGQIHCSLGPKHNQDLVPPMRLGSGPWFHALEIRFLLSEGAKAPTRERESLKNKSAYVIPVPPGFVLLANIIVGDHATALDCPLPLEFGGGQALWRTRLHDGRPAVLLTRILPLDNQNREQIKYIRETLKPTITFSNKPSEPYIEIHHVHWSEGGNVVMVIPMGDEAVRFEQDETGPTVGIDIRKFQYRSARSSTDVIAPNGLRVAVLEFDEIDKEIELVKNQPSVHTIGALKMRLEPGNLIAGSKFIASPCRLARVPTVGGGSPRNWEHIVFAKFDGISLSAELRPNSSSLRNKNLAAAVSQLNDREELLLTIPSETMRLVATMDAPDTSIEVRGRFTLRESR